MLKRTIFFTIPCHLTIKDKQLKVKHDGAAAKTALLKQPCQGFKP